jgi:zinc protease
VKEEAVARRVHALHSIECPAKEMRVSISLRSRIPACFGSLLIVVGATPAQAAVSASPSASRKPAAAAKSVPAPIQGPTVEGVTEYDYPNGFKLLLVPDASKPTVTVNITYLVGSRQEGYGETGMAHLLEHLVFKGTATHTDVPKALNNHGARFNGTTYFDRTNYFETMPASDANVEWGIRFEADRMLNSFIAQKDLDSEMSVVRNELEAGENDPRGVLLERITSSAYLWHNYGKSVVGDRSDVEHVSIEHLQAFYRKYYQPDNALLVLAGKFDQAKVLKTVGATFGRMIAPKRKIEPTYTVEPAQDGERLVSLRRVGGVQAVAAAYHVPASTHPDSAAVSVLVEVLGATPGGRLYRALVEPKKASSVFAFNRRLREPSLAIFFADVRKEDSLETARALFTQSIEETAAKPPSAEEVDRAKNAILRYLELSLAASDSVGIALTEAAAQGDWRLLFFYRDAIRRVTASDVRRVASAYLKPANRTLGLYLPTESPERAEIPQAPDIASVLRDYKGDAIATGEEFEATPQNLESRTTRLTYPGGLKLALLPKKTRGTTVFAQVSLRLGEEKILSNRKAAPEMAARMLIRGTRSKSRQQIKDELDRLKARVAISGGATSAHVSIESKNQEFPEVLKLVFEVLREPAFDAKEFELLRQEMLAQVESAQYEPSSVAFTAFQRHLKPWPKGHPLYHETHQESLEDIKATTLEETQKFYRELYGASFAQMAVVGDFDPAVVKPMIGERLASWKSPTPFVRIPIPYRDIGQKVVALETPDKANAYFLAGTNLALRDDDPDYPALVLANYLLGSAPLNSRLSTRLRQKDGLCYGTASWLSASAFDKEGGFGAYAIYAPENASRLEKGLIDEIERATRQGFTAEEVAQGKAAWLQSRQVSRAQDGTVAGALTGYLFYDRTYQWEADLEKKLAALSAAQVSEALKRHLDPKKITLVKAGDFAKKKPSASVASPTQQ